jgi:hypothetical protein
VLRECRIPLFWVGEQVTLSHRMWDPSILLRVKENPRTQIINTSDSTQRAFL